MKRAEKRDHLVGVATKLFNELGYRGVGIDHVIDESGIAKTTLYRHFESKDDLIVEVLRRIDQQYLDNMRNAVDKAAKDPKQKLLATFNVLEHWFKSNEFYGCPFLSAAAEYSERGSPVFKQSFAHKQAMIAYFEELTRAAGLRHPKRIAEEINLLHEGATAVAHISGDPKSARKAKAVAAKLIDDASH